MFTQLLKKTLFSRIIFLIAVVNFCLTSTPVSFANVFVSNSLRITPATRGNSLREKIKDDLAKRVKPEKIDPLVLSNIISLLEGAQTGGSNIEHAILDGANGGIFNHSERRGRLEIAMENMLLGIVDLNYTREEMQGSWTKTLKTENLSDIEIKTAESIFDDFITRAKYIEIYNGRIESKAIVEQFARRLVNYIMNVQLKKVFAYSDKHPIAQTVLCVGETEPQYKAKRTQEILKQDLEEILVGITQEQAQKINLRVAYEPRWAIGTGLTPTLDEIQFTHRFIKDTSKRILGIELDVDYGGSLNEKNCAKILALKDVDGGLIGGAAKDPKKIAVIIDEAIKQGEIKGRLLNVGMNWKAENTSTGLSPLDTFVELFRTKDLGKVHIAISTPNVKLVRDTITRLENEINEKIKRNIPKTKVAINGFGRIGKLVLKAYLEKKDNRFEVVAVNDLDSIDSLAHLFKYDSTFGRFKGEVKVEGDNLIINGKRIKVLSEKDPANLPWKDLGVEIAIEASGKFTKRDGASKHLQAGAKRVVITAPGENEDLMVVLGVNQDKYDPKKHQIISNASCTTNSLAPVIKVLKERFGIESGIMQTTHAATNDQNVLDAPHKDRRRSRASLGQMIPTTTGAAKAIGKIIPELNGKLDGFAMRTPTSDVSATFLVAYLKRDTTVEEVNAALKEAAQDGYFGQYLGYTEEELVSGDFLGSEKSSTVDASLTKVVGGKLVAIVAWYDNEWGYSNRTVDLVNYMLGREEELAKATKVEPKVVTRAITSTPTITQLPSNFLTIDDLGDVTGKLILDRPDLNAPVKEDGKISLTDRIVESAPTIRESAQKGARVVIIAHQGRLGDPDYLESMEQHAALLSKEVGRPIKYVHDLYGKDAVETILALKDGEILMLKNVRPGEDDPQFVASLEPLFYAFVNDAFSVSHRAQKSVIGFTRIPNVSGRLMQRELEGNRRFLTAIQHPYIELLGGSKISDHLDALEYGLNNGLIDRVLTGGMLGQLLLLSEGYKLGEPTEKVLREQDVDKKVRPEGLLTASFVYRLNAIYMAHKDKFELPIDLAYVDEQGARQEIPVKDLPKEGIPFLIGDNGTQTAEKYAGITKNAKTAFEKGPMGNYKKAQFRQGSEIVYKAVAENVPFWMTGGGDTDTLNQELDLKPTHKTLAGGAYLEFKAGKVLPGLVALDKSAKNIIQTARALNVDIAILCGFLSADNTIYAALGGEALTTYINSLRDSLEALRTTAARAGQPLSGKLSKAEFAAGQISDPLTIKEVSATQTTAGGSDTVRIDITLAGGARGHFVVPAGTSTGEDEAKTVGVEKALENVVKIQDEVTRRGLRADQLVEIGQLMLSIDKDKLGAEATLAFQMAAAWAAANQKGLQPYEFIRKLAPDLASQGVPITVIQDNITNGGAHAENSLDMQEFMIVPIGKTTAESNKMNDEVDRKLGLIYQALGLKADPDDKGLGELRGKEGGYKIEDLIQEKLADIYAHADSYKIKNLDILALREQNAGVHEFVLNCQLAAIQNAGYKPSTSKEPGTVALALDAAATSMLVEGHNDLYHFEGGQITSKELVKIYADWVKKYPIDSIEDGLGENDWEGWMNLIEAIGDKVLVIGDDLLVTQAGRLLKFIQHLRERGFIGADGKVTKKIAILIKLNQNGFLTTGIDDPKKGYLGTLEVIRLAKKHGIAWVVSHRSKEAEPGENEVSIAELAAGTNADLLKSGDHVQAVRAVKEDRLAEIDARERAKAQQEEGQVLIVAPGFFRVGGAISALEEAAGLKDITVALYGEDASKMKTLLANENIVTGKDLNEVLENLSGLGFSQQNTLLVRSPKDELDRELKIRQVVSGDISTLALAKAVKELVGSADVDVAFRNFLSNIIEAQVVDKTAISENSKNRILEKFEEGIFRFPEDVKMTKQVTQATEKARLTSAEFMDRV